MPLDLKYVVVSTIVLRCLLKAGNKEGIMFSWEVLLLMIILWPVFSVVFLLAIYGIGYIMCWTESRRIKNIPIHVAPEEIKPSKERPKIKKKCICYKQHTSNKKNCGCLCHDFDQFKTKKKKK